VRPASEVTTEPTVEAGRAATGRCSTTVEGSALARFRRALKVREQSSGLRGATELPRIELADALALTLLLASEQGNLFDKACVRWIGRLSATP
jgi:hypothetical protein